jgi:hypothetical protein
MDNPEKLTTRIVRRKIIEYRKGKLICTHAT